jgi:hypothetical protein
MCSASVDAKCMCERLLQLPLTNMHSAPLERARSRVQGNVVFWALKCMCERLLQLPLTNMHSTPLERARSCVQGNVVFWALNEGMAAGRHDVGAFFGPAFSFSPRLA